MFFSFCSSRIEPIAGLTDACSIIINIKKGKWLHSMGAIFVKGDKRNPVAENVFFVTFVRRRKKS